MKPGKREELARLLASTPVDMTALRGMLAPVEGTSPEAHRALAGLLAAVHITEEAYK